MWEGTWSKNIKDLNLTTWKFLRAYLNQIHQIPEFDRSFEQKHIYRQYDRFSETIIGLTDEDIEKLAFSSAVYFEISEYSLNESLRLLTDAHEEKKNFLNPAVFTSKPSTAHDEMLNGFMWFYMNEITEINKKIMEFFQKKFVLSDSDIYDNYASQILGPNGYMFAKEIMSNNDINFASHINKFEIKFVPRFQLKNIKKWKHASKKSSNVLTFMAVDFY